MIFSLPRRTSPLWIGLLFFTLFLVFGGCRGKQGSKAGQRAVLVTLAEVALQDVPVRLDALGHVEAIQSVSLKAQVSGQIRALHYQEGAEVKKGDLLVEIDPRPYQTALAQAKANLARDDAQARRATAELARYEPLLEKQLVSEEQVSQLRTSAESLEATVAGDRAAVENATLQLGWCRVLAPIDGVVGASLIDAGNVVRANESALVTINQVTPVSVLFALPAQRLPRIRVAAESGPLVVQAIIPGDETRPVQGELFFVNNTVDPLAGTIELKARFENADRRLWPGQFVQVQVELQTLPGARVIPAKALQSGQQGQFVYVVKPDSTAELRVVEVAFVAEELAVIESGLTTGEQVVIDGQLQVAPGGVVTPREKAGKGQGSQGTSP